MSVSVGDQVKIKGTDLTGKVTWKNIEKDRHEVTVDDIWYVLPEGALEVLPKPLKAGDTVVGVGAYDSLPEGSVFYAFGRTILKTLNGFVDSAGVERSHGAYSDPRKLLYVPES